MGKAVRCHKCGSMDVRHVRHDYMDVMACTNCKTVVREEDSR